MCYKWIFLLGLSAMLGACSQTVDSFDDEDSLEISSSAKKGASSSSKGGKATSSATEEPDEDCVGEPGKVWDGTTAKNFACGAGTKLSPYVILTAEQLAKLSFVIGANDKAYQGKYYKLGADIVLNKGKIIDDKGGLVADSAKLHKWTPIGNSSVSFTGLFDGDGHSVSGMFINTTSTHNGLFGNSSGTVQNVTVENSWVSGGKYTAGVVGSNIGTVQNSTNLASVSGKEECVGGVVGISKDKQYLQTSSLKKLLNKGVVVGLNDVGGVVGFVKNTVIDGLENFAQVEGSGYVGGVIGGIGAANLNDIRNLDNYGTVIGQHFVGGVSGYCGGASLNIYTSKQTASYSCSDATTWTCGALSNAHNEAHVSGKYYVGGVLGFVCGGKVGSLSNNSDVEGSFGTAGVVGSAAYVTSKNLYNRGNVYGEVYAGGIFSYNKEGVTSSAYSTGKVDGDSLVGLMIGYNFNTTMADYYYLKQGDQEPFGQNNGGGVATPKTEKEMKSKNFAELLGDDFVYDSGLNDGYPVLNWEKE